MIVDSSVWVAIVLGEADADRYIDAIAGAQDVIRLSSVTRVEAGIVVEARQGPDGARDLELALTRCEAVIEPVTADQAELAVAAWRRFGKGRHAASLNLGDCFSYALAEALGEPLLFKGDDFAQTDVRAAVT
jgi:ribonuclease VapC